MRRLWPILFLVAAFAVLASANLLPTGRYRWLDPNTGQPTRTHPMIAQAARSFLNKSENERSGVQSTALSFLTIYRDPEVKFGAKTVGAIRIA
jgi:type IV secretion system protein VirD4